MRGTDKLTNDQYIKHLFEVLKRVDSYIGTTNTKCTLIMSYCAAAIGIVALSTYRVIPTIENNLFLYFFGAICCFVFATGVACMFLAIKVIFPITFSSIERSKGDSVIFYGDVATFNGGAGGYHLKLQEITEDDFIKDLSQQIFTVSKIASDKFSKIQTISSLLIWLNFLPLVILLISCVIHSVICRNLV